MALVSTFELLVKRIAPTTGVPPIVAAAFRRIVQGYFLTVANPNERNVRLRMRARIPTTNFDPAFDRELVTGNTATRNHIYTYDITGGMNNGQVQYNDMFFGGSPCNGNQKLFSTGNLFLPACQTSAIKLLPDLSAAAVFATLGAPQLEIRGYIELVQVKTLRFINLGNGMIQIVIQSPDPVDLLLTPEIRGTALDNDYLVTANGLDFDQIAYSLPLASGRALVNIPESVGPFFPFFPQQDVQIALENVKITGNLNAAGKFNLSDESIREYGNLIREFQGQANDFGITLPKFCNDIEGYINSNQPFNIEEG